MTVPGWVLVGFYMAIYFAAWSWLCGRLRPREMLPAPVTASERETAPQPNESLPNPSPWLCSTKNLSLAFLLASAWVTQEVLRSLVLTGWGWNSLGSALHGQIAMIQITEYTGVAGLSFIVAFTNVIAMATVRRLVLEIHARPIRPHYDLTLTMVALVGLMAYGLHALQIHQPAKNPIGVLRRSITRSHTLDTCRPSQGLFAAPGRVFVGCAL